MEGVILKPIALVRCVVPNVRIMQCVKVDKEAAILKAGWRDRNTVGKIDANQMPFAGGLITKQVRNKEEFVG